MNGKRILIPVNLPRGPFDALSFAQGLADEVPVQVTLLNVVDLNVVALERRIYNEACAESEAALRKLVKLFFGDSPAVRINVCMGRPHEEIVAAAKAELAEFIVLPSSKPSRWRRLLGLGTIERVVRNAPCPTLVLPHVWKFTPELYRRAMRPWNQNRSPRTVLQSDVAMVNA